MNRVPVHVLVVEDSPVTQLLLLHIIESDPRLRVVGPVSSGEAALEFLQTQRPDVILMDVHLPGIDGLDTCRQIMQRRPLPIVVCSASLDPREVADTFRVLDAGALALVAKPLGLRHPDYAHRAAQLVDTLAQMAEVKRVPRWPATAAAVERAREQGRRSPPPRLVAIGASTGGPPALKALLTELRRPFPLPLLIVQHIAPGFVGGLADWLSSSSGQRCLLGNHGARAERGHVYLAPDHQHLAIDTELRLQLSDSAAENGLRPAVAHLFRALRTVPGAAVLLSGMGRDGAAELAELRALGRPTFAQDEVSAAVHGMPGEAIRLGAVAQGLAPAAIAAALNQLVATDGGSHASRA